MQVTLKCSVCGRILSTRVISAKEATVEVNPCLSCGAKEAVHMMNRTGSDRALLSKWAADALQEREKALGPVANQRTQGGLFDD